MPRIRSRWVLLAGLAVAARPAHAYVDLAPTIAKVVGDSKSIAVVELTSFDKLRHIVSCKEVKVLKGNAGGVPLTHQVAAADNAMVPRAVLQWAEPAAQAVVFCSGRTAVVCIGPAWYQLRLSSGDWKLGADRPELALTYYGSVSRLAEGLESILAGGDAILTMMPHAADRSASLDLALNRIAYPALVRLERVRTNLKMPGTVWAVSSNPAYQIGMGPVDEDELPVLQCRLESPDDTARAAAADDIRQLTEIVGAAKTKAAVVGLEKNLTDKSVRARFLAAAALLRIAHQHDGAIKVLVEGLASNEASVRRDAASASAGTGKAGSQLVPRLAALLEDKDDATRFAALQAIGTLGPAAVSARDAVKPLLNAPDLMIDAADALGRMGPRAQPVPGQLVKMLASDQAGVRQAALRSMAQIGGKEALPAVEYVVREIGKANEVEAYNMVEYLALLGPILSEAAARIKSVPIPNFILNDAANWAINAPQVLPWEDGATAAIGDLGNMVYASLVVELGERLKPCAQTLAPRLIAGTAGEVPQWGYQILNAAAEESIAIISPHLADKDRQMRERAALILGRMGPPAAGARQQLEAARATASDERERNLLTWSLAEISRD